MKVTVVVNSQDLLGEGVVWDDQLKKLYWVDIEGRKIHVLDTETGLVNTIPTPDRVGCLSPAVGGGFIVGMGTGVYRLDAAMKKYDLVCTTEHFPGFRLNDGKCSPGGQFFVGTIVSNPDDPEIRETGSLYRIDPDGSWEVVSPRVTISNGIAFDVTKNLMYYIDTFTHTVDCFDLDPVTGSLSNRRTVIRSAPEDASLDGMTIDTEGMLWIASWGGGKVMRWNPVSGEKLMEIKLPTPYVTCCTFAGPEMDELYITTASIALGPDEDKTGAGDLYHVKVPAKGIPVHRFNP